MKNYRNKINALCLLILVSFSVNLLATTNDIYPYNFIIGNCAIDINENIYTINPATPGLLNNSILNQNFLLSSTYQKIFFSQNLVIKLSKIHTILFGYALDSKKNIELQTSRFNLNYSLNLFDFIYAGFNLTYQDKEYKNFIRENLKVDLGLLISIKISETIRFINFGIYGLDSNPEKLSLSLPNTNYGKDSYLGFALGLKLNDNLLTILSFDNDLVRNNTILNPSEKTYKPGIQFNIGKTNPLISAKFLSKIYKNNFIGYSAGIRLNLKYFDLTYGIDELKDSNYKSEQLSVTFRIDSFNKKEDENKEIKISYYKEDENYKIIFSGPKKDIVFWKLKITTIDGEVIKEFSSNDTLPSFIIWDGKDKNLKPVPSGLYKLELIYIRDKLLLTIYKNRKDLYKDIF